MPSLALIKRKKYSGALINVEGSGLAAIIRKEPHTDLSLSRLLQTLSTNLFQEVPLTERVAGVNLKERKEGMPHQLMLSCQQPGGVGPPQAGSANSSLGACLRSLVLIEQPL